MIRAVLFDMDGLLFDTERTGVEILRKIVTGRYPARAEEIVTNYVRILGSTFTRSVGFLREQLGEEIPIENLLREMVETRHEMSYRGVIPPKPGMEYCLRTLHGEGLKTAVVTGSPAECAMRSVANLPSLDGCVDLFLSCEEVAHSKPAPDGYLEAARRLGVAPEECVGVEDSLNGVKSLRAAGALVVNIPDVIPFDSRFEPYVDHVLPDLFALPPLIRRLNRGGRLRA